MTYTVCRTDNRREPWAIMVHGGVIGRHKRRSGAVNIAKLLAGWRGEVVVEGRGK